MRRCAVLLFALVACRGGKDLPNDAGAGDHVSEAAAPALQAWPAFPANEREAAALIEARTTRRPVGASTELGADELIARIEATRNDSSLVVGLGAIDAWIGERARRDVRPDRSFYLLWGTHHDSAPQIELFRRLTGPLAITRWSHVVLEQLRADGRWGGVPVDAQAGDDEALRRWHKTHARDALAAVAGAQERDDYAAWKFGYVPAIVDVVAEGPASEHEVLGCDMTLSLAARLGPARATHGNSLRELHCALATSDVLGTGGPHRVAALWGSQHVDAGGFARFLPTLSTVVSIRAVGGRPASAADPIAKALAARYDILEPLLVPLGASGSEAVVVLEDPAAASHFERKRVKTTDPVIDRPDAVLSISSAFAGEVTLDGTRVIPVGPSASSERIAFGAHVLAAPRGTRRLLTSFFVPRGGSIELRLERTEPEVTLTVHAL